MPYLRNSIAYDHDFWYTSVKWWYLSVFFFFFLKFSFFRLLGGKRGKNDLRWQKIMSGALHISGTIYHMIVIYGTCVRWWYLQVFFFSCFENFDSLGCWGQEVKKGKKWSKMRKNSVCCAWYFRNHRSYDHRLCYTKVKW